MLTQFCSSHVAFVGMITGQTFVYFNKRKRCVSFTQVPTPFTIICVSDHAWLRVFIALLLMANLLNCGFNVAYLYGVLVKGYGSYPRSTRVPVLTAQSSQRRRLPEYRLEYVWGSVFSR
jgi:hypothetical protein